MNLRFSGIITDFITDATFLGARTFKSENEFVGVGLNCIVWNWK